MTTMNRSEIRAFIAIELPEELKDLLRLFEAKLRRPESRCAKWVDADSIHLTLKFLGNVAPELVEQIIKALETDVASCSAFVLRTADAGCFPNIQRMRIYWLGLEGDNEKLIDLQSRIDVSMARLGFPRENRPFAAHLTLARLKEESSSVERKAFTDLTGNAQFQPGYTMKVKSVSLMRSQLTPGGAIYSQLARFDLKD